MEEKRVKLGVDVGELSNQIVQLDNYIEQNYQKAIRGQTLYNEILEKSIKLLQEQVDLVGKSGPNQIASSVSDFKTFSIGDKGEDLSETNELLEKILTNTNGIWEKFSTSSFFNASSANVPTSTDGENDGEIGEKSNNTKREKENKKDKSGGDGGARAIGTTSNLMASGASDPNYILAGLVGMMPIVGAGLAAVANKMINEAEQRVEARATFIGATGENVNMPFMSLHNLGYKDAEAYKKEAQYYPSNVHLKVEDLQFEKGYGVGGGTMDSLLRSMREDVIQEKYKISSSELGVSYLDRLKVAGKIDSTEVRGYTEDYLKILINLNQQQLEVTGETNSLINSELISSIAGISEKFSSPVVLQNMISSIKGGLSQASSPQAEALQYMALSEVNPDADLWEMGLMKENPFSEKSRGYLTTYLEKLLKTGNDRDIRFNVESGLGLTKTQTEELLTKIDEAKAKAEKDKKPFNLLNFLEGADFGNLTKEGAKFETNAGVQIGREAANATAPNEVLLAKTSDVLADVGESMLELTGKAVELTGEAVDKMSTFFESGLSGTLKAFWEDIKKEITPSWLGGTPSASQKKEGNGKVNNMYTHYVNSSSPNQGKKVK